MENSLHLSIHPSINLLIQSLLESLPPSGHTYLQSLPEDGQEIQQSGPHGPVWFTEIAASQTDAPAWDLLQENPDQVLILHDLLILHDSLKEEIDLQVGGVPGQLGPRHAPDDLPVGVMNVAFDIYGLEGTGIVLTQVLEQLIRDAVVLEGQGHQVAEHGHGLVELRAAVDSEVLAEEVLDVEL